MRGRWPFKKKPPRGVTLLHRGKKEIKSCQKMASTSHATRGASRFWAVNPGELLAATPTPIYIWLERASFFQSRPRNKRAQCDRMTNGRHLETKLVLARLPVFEPISSWPGYARQGAWSPQLRVLVINMAKYIGLEPTLQQTDLTRRRGPLWSRQTQKMHI